MEYIKPFYNDKNLIKDKDLENFARVLYEKEKKDDGKETIDYSDTNMSVFLELKYCIKKWFDETKSIEKTLNTATLQHEVKHLTNLLKLLHFFIK